MSTTLSTNMSLPIPGVGTEPGPDYASDVNNCFSILDQHNHSAGSGVLITPSGLNINSTLTFNNSALTDAQILGMSAQSIDPSNLGAFYYKGVDLYFNDGSGNHIRMTASGSVSGATGTITGLPSGTASASYQSGSGTFVFQSATNTPADIDGRSFILRNNAASSKGLTLSPPAAMGSDIAMAFPTIPAQQNVMTMDSGGGMGTVTWNDVATNRSRSTGTTVAAGGVAISASSGSFSTSSATYVAVTNLSVTITTSGRPVFVGLISDGSALISDLAISGVATAGFGIFRDATEVGTYFLSTSNIIIPSSTLSSIDAVGAGTYTYSMKALCSGGSISVIRAKLVAYEL